MKDKDLIKTNIATAYQLGMIDLSEYLKLLRELQFLTESVYGLTRSK